MPLISRLMWFRWPQEVSFPRREHWMVAHLCRPHPFEVLRLDVASSSALPRPPLPLQPWPWMGMGRRIKPILSFFVYSYVRMLLKTVCPKMETDLFSFRYNESMKIWMIRLWQKTVLMFSKVNGPQFPSSVDLDRPSYFKWIKKNESFSKTFNCWNLEIS